HVIWMRSASQALAAAIAIARRRTGRPQIARFEGGTRGVAAAAVPVATVSGELYMRFGSDESLVDIRRQADAIAAIVVDVMADDLPDAVARTFLQRLRSMATELGILLILDERASGFRLHPAGAQGYFGIHGDLAVYG